jgi:2-methylisocitrate lyase-like PEP mutase family enzyme
MHLEDQVQAKRCGHRPGKALVAVGKKGRSHQGGGRRVHRSQLLGDGAYRRACRGRPERCHRAYATIRKDGTQRSLIGSMQMRAELYDVLGYHADEGKLDELFGTPGSSSTGPQS